MPLNVGLRSCGALCQHPGCWDAIRKVEKGITKSLPPLDFSSSDDSDSELDLPTQNVCNLLADFGESPTDRYPVSVGGRPSHQWDAPLPTHSADSIVRRKEITFSPKKLQAPYNTKASIFSKKRSTAVHAPRPRQPRMPLVEVQEVFDRTDLNSQWDETFVTKQYYIWVANPQKKKKRRMGDHGIETQRDPNAPVLMKNMTECMVPPEIEQQREDTVLKKQPRTVSPPSKSLQFKKAAPPALPAPPLIDVDMEGINELLALPKDVLLKVLENTKKSDFTSKGKIHEIVQEYVQGSDSARMMLSTRELLRQKKMKILNIPKGTVHKSLPGPLPKPVFHVDDEQVIERMSSVNTPIKDKDACSDDSSVEYFPRYSKPLPKIQGHPHLSYDLAGPGELIHANPNSVRMPLKAKLPSISLGLPELPSGVKTTRAFAYNNKNPMDFSLGPVISPPTTHRSSESGDYSEHGTTVKVNAPMSGLGYVESDRLFHSVSPALSTNVPVAPAGTPATFMSPTKSAPNLREISRDLTQLTANLSLRAQLSSSKDMRGTAFLSSPTTGQPLQYQHPTSPIMDPTKFSMTPDDKGLDTIRETARETVGVDGSVMSSSHGTLGDKMDEPPKLVLQTSTMTNINTGASPLPKSARSVESCPSPEQWPLISESSFEKMIPRSSVSEPALSGRSGRRSKSRSLDDNGRDYARKVMVEKNSAESPAPPPPSPEPKDNNEYRARKDLKSRESLSMAPLFEVNEIDEEMYSETENDGRRKQVRKIHAIIPQANTDDDNNKNVESEDQVEEEVMVSQITVMHVAPKGITAEGNAHHNGAGPVKREKEKVQETFLNVDIPAEEISSCKAEHGSSRQEDISSTNDSAAKSEAMTTKSEVSSSSASKVNDKENDDNNDDDYVHGERQDSKREEEKQENIEEGKDTEERQYLDMQSDFIHRERNASAKLNSEDSGVSQELVCDSARFMSHDLVSPIEGELDEGQLQMMSFLLQVEGRASDGTITTGKATSEPSNDIKNSPVLIENENEGKDTDTMAEESGKILGELDYAGEREILGEESHRNEECLEDMRKDGKEMSSDSNATPGSNNIEPPGRFFFQNNGADKKVIDTEGTGEFDVEEKTENKKNAAAVESNMEGEIGLNESGAVNEKGEEGNTNSVGNREEKQEALGKGIEIDTENEEISFSEKIKGMLDDETGSNSSVADGQYNCPKEHEAANVEGDLSKGLQEESVKNENIPSEQREICLVDSSDDFEKQDNKAKNIEGDFIETSTENDNVENGDHRFLKEEENLEDENDFCNNKDKDHHEKE